MKTKNWIRTAVVAGLIAWPALETYRYYVAKNELSASVELNRDVTEKLTLAKLRHSLVAQSGAEEAPPVRKQ